MGYKVTEIAKKTKQKSRRRVQYLIDSGVLIPDEAGPSGKGKAQILSERNLVELAMVEVMQDEWGCSLATIRDALRLLREKAPQPDNPIRIRDRKGGWISRNFYEHPMWGRGHEFLYIENIPNNQPDLIPTHWYSLVLINGEVSDYLRDVPEEAHDRYAIPDSIYSQRLNEGPVLLIPMGKVRNLALRRLGMGE